ncbi:viroplasmin family protein [Lachnospira multipara]|uniref:ribonuclease H1 domain-containing protein n=1 Tax=Lachnospira multipara TaxID=28051 RepID=UPI0004E1DE70|nr:ribonuclease H family protein [Lachnospira multipara]
MAKKYYAVRQGRKTGIFESWDECKSNVTGFKGAEYKSFTTLQEAKDYLETNSLSIKEDSKDTLTSGKKVSLDDNYAFVDGSFNIATGVYGFGGFLIAAGNKYELMGSGNDKEMVSMRNVSGEILGSRAAIEKAIELGLSEISIYFDYMGIRAWALGEWKRNKKGTMEYYDFIQSVKDKIKINFVKVKGHSGVDGNEEADRLAKKAVGII